LFFLAFDWANPVFPIASRAAADIPINPNSRRPIMISLLVFLKKSGLALAESRCGDLIDPDVSRVSGLMPDRAGCYSGLSVRLRKDSDAVRRSAQL
jgi:hypothetical protein